MDAKNAAAELKNAKYQYEMKQREDRQKQLAALQTQHVENLQRHQAADSTLSRALSTIEGALPWAR